MNMELPNNNSLDFTSNAQVEEGSGKLIVPGVGVMSIDEAKSLVAPGIIPGSNIEFGHDYSVEKLTAFRDAMEEYRGLFSERDVKTYAGFIAEIEKRLLTKQALEELERKTGETLH